jgi:hypothetical protein
MWTEGECSWCRQCGREKERDGRRDGVRERLAGEGRGRFVRWGG